LYLLPKNTINKIDQQRQKKSATNKPKNESRIAN